MANKVTVQGHLTITKWGVFLHPADAKTRPARKVARRIVVWAWVTVEGTTAKFVDVRFFDRDNKIVELTISPSELNDLRQLSRLLLDHGYQLPSDAKITRMLHSYLVDQTPKQHRHVIHRQGWHGKHFVFAGEPIRVAGRILSFTPANPDHARNFGMGGTLQGWQDGVAKYARHSTRMILAISLAFASALLEFSDVENGGIHLSRDSTSGKTTFLLAAASVGGRAVRNDLYSWDNTKTGLEELAAAYNNNLLCLDETQRAEDITTVRAKVIRDAVFKIAGGTGRIRATLYRAKMGLQPIKWRSLFFSTGEKSLNEIARIDAMDRLEGELVRAIDLPVLVHDQYKGFESLPSEHGTASKLAEHIEAECRINYGVALREFVRYVGEDMATIKTDIAAEMEAFFKGARVPEEGWERRFAKRFALAYAAAILAIKYGIVPWDAKLAARAMTACYRAAREAVPDSDQLRADGLAVLQAQLGNKKKILDLRRSGHKVHWTYEQAQAAQIFRRLEPEGAYFLVAPATFLSWFKSERQAKLVLDELDTRRFLIKGTRNLRTIQTPISGIDGKGSYHAILETVLTAA